MMTYTEQIEQWVASYPTTSAVSVPYGCGVAALPAYPHVEVRGWGEDFCELEDAGGNELARFRLVG